MKDSLTKVANHVEMLGIQHRKVGLLKLAQAIRQEANLLAAVNKVFFDKPASYRAKMAGMLARKEANMMQPMQVPPQAQMAPQMGAQPAMMQSPNGARASALMNRLTGGVQQMQQQQQAQQQMPQEAMPQEGMPQ